MKDIALRCGVSVSTVSKALNGRGDVGEAKKEQILEAAKVLGYTANSAARALKTNRTYSIGIVFTDLSNSGFMHEYFASMLNYFRMEAERRGYDITFISENMGPANAGYLQHARARGLDGVAIICADFFDPMIQEPTPSTIGRPSSPTTCAGWNPLSDMCMERGTAVSPISMEILRP